MIFPFFFNRAHQGLKETLVVPDWMADQVWMALRVLPEAQVAQDAQDQEGAKETPDSPDNRAHQVGYLKRNLDFSVL